MKSLTGVNAGQKKHNKKMKEFYSEVKNDYNNGEGFICIDAWKTDDPDEPGKTVAAVHKTTGDIFYIEPEARLSPKVAEALRDIVPNVSNNKAITTDTIKGWVNSAIKTAREKGWHATIYSSIHFLTLIGTEVAEAIQADRNRRHANPQFVSLIRSIQSDNEFEVEFDKNIKETFEDELADIVIRCCDLLGLRNENCQRVTKTAPNPWAVFTLTAYEWLQKLTDKSAPPIEKVCSVINGVIDYCQEKDIDIGTFIEMKMRFNKTRPYMHGGKKY